MIRPTVNVNGRDRARFVAVTREVAAQKSRRELETLGERWETNVSRIVRTELPRRDGDRHKKNTTHLENAFTYQVEGNEFPMRLVLTTKPGVEAAKVAALNNGVKGTHTIRAKKTNYLRWGNHPQDLTNGRLREVTWSPDGPTAGQGGTGRIKDGWHFMERALEQTLGSRFGSRFR